MAFAIIVLAYFLTLQFVATRVDYSNSRFLPYFVSLISLIILNILRVYCQEYFPDIPNYKAIFEEIPAVSSIINADFRVDYYPPNIEIGFSLFISIFKFFSESYSWFLFFVSLIELLVFNIFCSKHRINIVNAIPVYLSFNYLTFQIGMLRQAMAFCIFLLALIYINRKIIYFIFILIGLSLHNSMIFCALLFWTDKIVNRVFYHIVFFLSIFLYVLKIDIISMFLPYVPLGDALSGGRISYYLDVNRPNAYLGIGFWDRLILYILMNLVYTRLVLKNEINKYNNLIFNLGISVIILQMVFFSSPTITSRLRYYTVLFPVIFISEYVYSKEKEGLTWLYQLLFIPYLLMYLIFQANYLISTD